MLLNEKKINRTLHVGSPNIGDRELFDQLVNEIFENRWFTNGGAIEQRLENRLCDYLDVKHCIPVCNATVGLQLVCHALDLQGEVILPAFTFVATAHAVQWERLTPVFADVDPQTHTICPQSAEALISDKTSAIIGVHLWGQSCDTEALQNLAEQHQLELFYDAAHAFGCRAHGQMIGNFGRCEVFSFHATKFFNTFEGGAIATNDDELAAKIRLMKNFGFSGLDQVVHLGTNAKMAEINAAMGLAVFAKLDDIVQKNQENHQHYRQLLDPIPGIRFLNYDHVEASNWQYVVLEIEQEQFGVSRDEVLEHLHRHQIRARRYFYPGCHRMEPYQSDSRHLKTPLTQTERLCERVLCLPTGNAISKDEIGQVCQHLLELKTP